MEASNLGQQLRSLFPILSQTGLVLDIVQKGQFVELPAGAQLLDLGNIIKVVPLVLSGSVKVVREDEEGNEIFLYYIRKGESCAMTLTSCLKREKSAIKAIVEQQVRAIAVPVEAIYDFVHRYPSWNDFIVETFSKRFEEILEVVDHIAFHQLDVRLLKYLMGRGKMLDTNVLEMSKTAIARDLNSSREVISRLLKQMEKNKLIRMSGQKIELL